MASRLRDAPVAILALDRRGRIDEANLAAISLLGVGLDEIVGEPLSSFLPELERSERTTALLHRPSGSRLLVEVRRSDSAAGEVLALTDATERFEVDAALRARRKVIEAASATAELAAVLDRHGVVLAASGRIAEDAGGESIVGRHWRDFVDPRDAATVQEAWATLPVEGSDMRSLEVRVVDATGRPTWVEALVYLSRADDGSPASYSALLRDISERHQREHDLRKSERQLHDAFERSSAGLAIGERGVLVRCNRALCDLLGRGPDELMGHDLVEFTHPDDRDRTAAAHKASDPVQYEKRYIRPDGSVVWGLVGGAVVRNDRGQPLHYVASIVDITERKRTEEELARRAAQQAAVVALGREALAGATGDELFDAAIQAIVDHLDADHAGLLEMLPHGGGLLLRRGLGWDVDVSRVRIPFESLAGFALMTGETVVADDLTTETRFTPSQLLRDHGVRSSVCVVITVDGERYGVLGAFAKEPMRFSRDDVTFLQSVADVVGSAVARERYAEIAERAHQQDRLAVVGQLAAGLAHDFNNVLTVVKLHAELLGRQPGLTDEGRRQTATISDQTDRAIALVWQLLDVARRGEIVAGPLDLGEFVHQLVPVVERTLPATITMEVRVEPGRSVVLADVSRLNQIVLNLLGNARDAMGEGGRLGITVRNEACQGRGGHVLEISDTGCGMTPEVAARAFDPFFSTKGPGQGTGLGLPQVRALVDQHQGDVTLESQPGAGTTVRVWLPAPEGASPVHDARPDTIDRPPDGDGELILVVEDDLAVAGAVAAQLRDLGYRVELAEHGGEALAFLEQSDADLVLSDLAMPVLGGEELARRLRRHRPEIPIVLTGAQSVSDPALADIGWLQKPYPRERLADVVAAALGRR